MANQTPGAVQVLVDFTMHAGKSLASAGFKATQHCAKYGFYLGCKVCQTTVTLLVSGLYYGKDFLVTQMKKALAERGVKPYQSTPAQTPGMRTPEEKVKRSVPTTLIGIAEDKHKIATDVPKEIGENEYYKWHRARIFDAQSLPELQSAYHLYKREMIRMSANHHDAIEALYKARNKHLEEKERSKTTQNQLVKKITRQKLTSNDISEKVNTLIKKLKVEKSKVKLKNLLKEIEKLKAYPDTYKLLKNTHQAQLNKLR